MTQALLQAIRGMNDVLPEEMHYWHYVEATIRALAARYGYQEIRTPAVEHTELFARSIGEITDIVEKEMYTFLDRNQDSLTLRPELTAGCVRAGIEHGLFHNQLLRLWYLGPIFRHERPQRGRYRQFYQFGVEAFGMVAPAIDAEIIMMSARLWQMLGLHQELELQINTLGTLASRMEHRQVLIDYLHQHIDQLDPDSQRRLYSNPLRILDSKNPNMQALIEGAPSLSQFLDANSKQHFEALQQILTNAGISFKVNPRLVRGLDYYSDTVFEWITTKLGAQGTVCAGGRYDGLVSQLGGKAVPGIGFAMGCERVIELIKELSLYTKIPQIDAYLILVGKEALYRGLLLAEELRENLPQLRLLTHCGEGSFKSQFKRADNSGALTALIIGEDELKSGTISIKFLRDSNKEQMTMNQNELVIQLGKILKNREME